MDYFESRGPIGLMKLIVGVVVGLAIFAWAAAKQAGERWLVMLAASGWLAAVIFLASNSIRSKHVPLAVITDKVEDWQNIFTLIIVYHIIGCGFIIIAGMILRFIGWLEYKEAYFRHLQRTMKERQIK